MTEFEKILVDILAKESSQKSPQFARPKKPKRKKIPKEDGINLTFPKMTFGNIIKMLLWGVTALFVVTFMLSHDKKIRGK